MTLADFAELKLLIDEYDPANSDWQFRKNVLLDVLLRIWPKEDERPHKVMTPEEYATTPLKGWHMVCRDVDGFGGTGVRYLGRPHIQNDVCRLCNRPLGEHSMDTADICNAFIGGSK